VAQQDRGEVGFGDLAGAVRDQRQRLVVPDLAQQRGGDLGRGLQPALPPRGLLVEPGVLDDDPGGRGERDDDLLVVCGEPAAGLLLGQVEVPEHGVADADRHPEEGAHRRMVRREAERHLVVPQRVQPERLRGVDDDAEQTVPARQVPDPGPLLGAHAVGHERPQPAVRPRPEHPQRAVPGVREPAGDPHDPLEDAVEVEVRRDADDCVQQAPEPVLGVHHLADPR